MNRDILLSAGDLERIAAHTGDRSFYELRRPQETAYLEQDDDPNWNFYTLSRDGCRRVSKHAAPGVCWFLTAHGCRLPEEVRPLVCRLHPLEYTESGITGPSPDCPDEWLAPGESLLANLHMDLRTAEEWHRQLYDELRREAARGAATSPEERPGNPEPGD